MVRQKNIRVSGGLVTIECHRLALQTIFGYVMLNSRCLSRLPWSVNNEHLAREHPIREKPVNITSYEHVSSTTADYTIASFWIAIPNYE